MAGDRVVSAVDCYAGAGHQVVSGCSMRGESQGTYVMYPLPSVNKASHSDFETQGRCHQKSKTGVSVAP